MKKLVSARLQAQAPGPHPDPEMLAAYAENSLSPPDRHSLLTHLAACTDCRDALYLAMPEADIQPVLKAPYKSPRLAVRWATLAASVVVVGAVLLTNREMFYQHSASVQTYPATPPEKVADLKERKLDRFANTREPAAQPAAKVLPPLKHMTAKPQARMQFDQSDEVRLAAAQTVSGTKQDATARVSSEAVTVPQARDDKPARVSSEAVMISQAGLAKKGTSKLDWALSPNGDVQRSLDFGKTWQIVPVNDGSSFHAITSIGNEVWVGGSAGALFHSVDAGQSWTKLGPVSTDDVTHIEFSDPQNGLLNTANGRVWRTFDGGRSWHSE